MIFFLFISEDFAANLFPSLVCLFKIIWSILSCSCFTSELVPVLLLVLYCSLHKFVEIGDKMTSLGFSMVKIRHEHEPNVGC